MNHKLLSLAGALVVAGTLGHQTFGAALNSALFNHQYNGNVVPVPNYTKSGSFATEPGTDGDILTFRVPGGGGTFTSTDWSASGTPGFTMEFRIKIDNDFAEASKGAFAVYFGDGFAGDGFSVGKNSVWAGVGALQIDSNNNTDAFHIFRIAQVEDGGGPANPTIKMWRDDVLINTWPNGGNLATSQLVWGSGGGIFGGPTVHLDYFRWDNTGAFENGPLPVPEPSVMAVLAIGGGLLLWRRRSKKME